MQASTPALALKHTASFECKRLWLKSSVRSHNNYFKLLKGTQVLVGYITCTLTEVNFSLYLHMYNLLAFYILPPLRWKDKVCFFYWHLSVCLSVSEIM